MRALVYISLLPASLFGIQFSPTEVLDSIRSRYASMEDASAAFTQSVKMKYKPNGQSQTGTVMIKRGNKFRIETEQQTITTDGKTVWMYNPAGNQVLIDSYKPGQAFSPDKFLAGLPKEFTPAGIERSGNMIILSLRHTISPTNTSTLKVWTSAESWSISRIEMIDKNGTSTSIELAGLQFNRGLHDSLFQFAVTKEMKIVDLKNIR